jgi:hypothetical protein
VMTFWKLQFSSEFIDLYTPYTHINRSNLANILYATTSEQKKRELNINTE